MQLEFHRPGNLLHRIYMHISYVLGVSNLDISNTITGTATVALSSHAA